MPQLKQLSCTVQWANTEVSFQEYGTVYGDGLVESFIVVPNKPQPFTIRLKSLKYICEGLAMIVFIDGNYQANRNRVNLKPFKKITLPNQTEVDFLVRQKEKPLGEGVYMGRQWRFDNHNIVEDLPAGVKESHFDLLGTIEVLVLRCRARESEEEEEDSGFSSGADSDALGEKGDRAIFEENNETNQKSSNNDGPAEEDEVIGLMGSLLLGGDATNEHDHRYSWNGSGPPPHGGWPPLHHPHANHARSHSQHQTSAPKAFHRQQASSSHAPHHHQPAPQRPTSQKQVRFDLDPQQLAPDIPHHDRPPSYERVRNPVQRQPHSFHYPAVATHPHPTQFPSRFEPPPFDHSHHYHEPERYQQKHPTNSSADYTAPQSMPMPMHGPSLPPPLAVHPYHIPHYPQTQSHNASPYHRPPWLSHPPHLIFNPYYHINGAAWPPHRGNSFTNPTNANGNPSPVTITDSSKGSNNPANNQQQSQNQSSSTNDWAKPDNNETSWTENNNSNNNDSNSNWNTSNQNSGNTGDWSDKNNDNNQSNGGDQSWQNSGQSNDNTDNSWATPGNNDNNNTWQNDANAGGWDNNASTQNNENSWDNRNDAGNSNEDKDTESKPRALFGPHGQYYTYAPRGPDEPGADVEEEPRYDVPKRIAETTGSTKQVVPGSGYMYWKKRRAPEYIDTVEEPYARFVFKYRTKGTVVSTAGKPYTNLSLEQLEKEIGIKVEVEPTGDEAMRELQEMDKQALVEMLVRAKSALGGKVPSPRLQAATSASKDGELIAVDPPNHSFLKYKLPDFTRKMSDHGSVAGSTNDNQESPAGGDSNNNGNDGNWATNNNDNSNGTQANNNPIDWSSNGNSNRGNTSRRKDGDGVTGNPRANKSNTDWTNPGSVHSSPSILPLDPFNPNAPPGPSQADAVRHVQW